MSVEVELRVGMIDMSLAQLLTKDHRIIEFPSILLPDDVIPGSIVKLSCERARKSEASDEQLFEKIQSEILETFTKEPETPVLRVHNYTQTSVVLEWDPIDPGSTELISLALYKNGQQLGLIPNPEKRVSTKLSNLEVDKQYQFELVLITSAGVYRSNLIDVHTHKMTDLSGLTVCVGSLEGSDLSLEDIEATVKHIGCRPLQTEVHLDTTHFICTEPDQGQYLRAQQRNVPIVRPQWLKACESERRLVEVRQYYLSEDPRLIAPFRQRRGSVATAATDGDASVADDSSVTNSRGEGDSTHNVSLQEERRPAEGPSTLSLVDGNAASRASINSYVESAASDASDTGAGTAEPEASEVDHTRKGSQASIPSISLQPPAEDLPEQTEPKEPTGAELEPVLEARETLGTEAEIDAIKATEDVALENVEADLKEQEDAKPATGTQEPIQIPEAELGDSSHARTDKVEESPEETIAPEVSDEAKADQIKAQHEPSESVTEDTEVPTPSNADASEQEQEEPTKTSTTADEGTDEKSETPDVAHEAPDASLASVDLGTPEPESTDTPKASPKKKNKKKKGKK